MKIGFYDPYLDTMGGGEKYFLDAAAYLAQKGHAISFFWSPSKKNDIEVKAKDRFSISIAPLTFLPNIFSSRHSFLTKYNVTKSFDVIFYLSDGSVPFLFSKNNILMFQHPVNWVKGRSLLNTLKLKKINTIICNSEFTEKAIDKTFSSQKTRVVYPPVKSVKKDAVKKEKIILSVGRFSEGMNAKKHDRLIEAFKILHQSAKDWELVLIGGMKDDAKEFVETLKNDAKELPVTILPNADYATLVDYYNRATIYWHAAGFDVDIEKYPERTEHFGISVVEAMSTGCVPIVFNASGPAEIIDDEKFGFVWNTLDELVEKTEQVIKDKQIKTLQENAEIRAKDFSEHIFYESIDKLIAQ